MKTVPTSPAQPARHPVVRTLLGLLGIFILLALITCDPEDADFLAGGLDLAIGCHNIGGIFGATCAWTLYLFLGLAAYAIPLLLLAFSLFLDRATSAWYRWPTLLGILCLPLCLSMLLGLSPTLLPELTQYANQYNLGGMPGGAIGQRLCEPKTGILYLLANDIGCLFLATAILIASMLRLLNYFGIDLFASRPESTAPSVSPFAVQRPAPATEPAAAPQPNLPVPRPTAAQPSASLLAPKDEKDGGLLRSALGWFSSKEDKDAQKQPATNLLGQAVASRRTDTAAGNDPLFAGTAMPAPTPPPAASCPPPAAAPEPTSGASVAMPLPLAVKTAPPPVPASFRKSGGRFELPPTSLLQAGTGGVASADPKEIEINKAILQNTLNSFNIPAKVGDIISGPRVTLYEVVPEPGIKVERIVNIQANIAMDLKAQSIRILAPIPGKNSVGIEIPNRSPSPVPFHDLLADSAWGTTRAHLPILLGRSISGEVAMLDLAKAPHLLIAGATGSGKSVCINTMIMSLLYRFSPEELRLIMVDPKVVEFAPYHSLPHLVVPVISEVTKVPLALRWTINEMERRYRVLAAVGCKNIETFNARTAPDLSATDHEGKPIPAKLPFIVVIIDELADIMMTAKQDVETSLAKIAQKSRAVGIHTVVATQRPSVNVITGVIKANFPTRIAFQVTSLVDSRTILDGKGAEALLGMGDMLFKPPNAVGLQRNQGAFVSDAEIERVVAFVSKQQPQAFDDSVFKAAAAPDEAGGEEDDETPELPFRLGGAEAPADDEEGLLEQATEIILRDRKTSISYLQRRMGIGYNKAASLIEKLEQRGVVGPQIGNVPREILIDRTNSAKGTAAPGYDPYEDDPR